jgi:OOP family OmpA-OmpF porin
MLAHVNKDGPTPEERRFRAAAILLVGAVALTLLGVWAVILRRAPIEEDLTSRSAAILENADIDATGLHFDGRDGSVTVEASLAADAGRVLASLDGLRVIVISSAAPPVTTTTTVPITTTTTAATTTTTTIPVPEARFTLTSLAGQVTLSGRLPVTAATAAVSAADETFGIDRVIDSITADDDTTSPTWTTGLPNAITILRGVADPGLAIDGGTVTLAGDIASEQRRIAILEAFGGLGLEVADGLSIAPPPDQTTAAALETSLNAALGDVSILFETGSSAITSAGTSQLDAIADLLLAVPGARVEVAGHTDSEGPPDGNLILSVERAESVVAHLIAGGVDPVQLTAVGYGQERPIADNTTPEGRAANRRIEFTVEGSE